MKSESNEQTKLSPDECIAKWRADIRQDRSRQYLFRDRKEHLELLMGYFKSNDVGMIEATALKRKVVESLVHSEGMKNQGKYKDWKKTVEEDYDDWIQVAYVPSLTIPKVAAQKSYVQKPEIVQWAKDVFGEDVNPQLLRECHTIGNSLHIYFINDFYQRGV